MAIEIREPPALEGPAREAVDYARRELEQLAQAINQGLELLRTIELNAEPAKPRDGMVVYADGTNWDPGSGEGFYGRENGAWVKL